MMARIETSVTIARPQRAVFEYLTDLRNAKEWSTEVVDVTYDGQLGKGTTGSDIRRFGRKEMVMPWKVVSFASPDGMTIQYERPFPMTAEFSFQDLGGATRVSCSTDLMPRGWWRLLSPVLSLEGKKADRVQFEKVKAILEGTNGNGAKNER